ncbi:MAG: enolase C-terminal domain-like protein [Mycobacteriales bacterium]
MAEPAIEEVSARAYEVPTETPESDGTLEWDSTTMIVVEVRAGGRSGLGYSYAHSAAAGYVTGKLAGTITGRSALRVGECWAAMWVASRNMGRPGLVATAVSAVDVALWDLKARLLGIPLVTALDSCHDRCPVYGSGGFTSYDDAELADQLSGWVAAGIPRVKMKVGRDPGRDAVRARVAREAIGPETELFVDANGAYTRKQALEWALRFRDDFDVRWLEEPVSSDDLIGLHLLRDRGPGGMDIAAGEYGYTPEYFRDMLAAGAVDCLQVDVTRAGGITGFRLAAALAAAHGVEVSPHCAPQISAQAACAAPKLRHLEYFHDHNRIEAMAFDGILPLEAGGYLRPDRDRQGHGLVLKSAEMEPYRVS